MTMDMSDEDKQTLDQSSEQNFSEGEAAFRQNVSNIVADRLASRNPSPSNESSNPGAKFYERQSARTSAEGNKKAYGGVEFPDYLENNQLLKEVDAEDRDPDPTNGIVVSGANRGPKGVMGKKHGSHTGYSRPGPTSSKRGDY